MAVKTGRTFVTKSISISPDQLPMLEARMRELGVGWTDYFQRLVGLDKSSPDTELAMRAYTQLEHVHTALTVATSVDGLPPKIMDRLEKAEAVLNAVRQDLYASAASVAGQSGPSQEYPPTGKAALHTGNTGQPKGGAPKLQGFQPPAEVLAQVRRDKKKASQ